MAVTSIFLFISLSNQSYESFNRRSTKWKPNIKKLSIYQRTLQSPEEIFVSPQSELNARLPAGLKPSLKNINI